MTRNRIGRNDPCPCGSGKKYKKCCLLQFESLGHTILAPQPFFVRPPGPSPAEPYLDLVQSVIWKGKRWRAIFNKLYYRPQEETFHEFLINVIKWTFGETWWKQQIGMQEKDRHIVIKWTYLFADITKVLPKDAAGPPYTSLANGPVWALLSLGYDLFCLQAKNRLPEFIVERLRRHQSFQGARYEAAVAAIMMRSGFDVQFLDEAGISKKHCEFIAAHKTQPIQIGVEAKSRRRPGSVHEQGSFSQSEDARGLENLIRQAKKQRPSGMPFLIFVDLNLPSSIGLKIDERPWLRDAKLVIDRIGPASIESPDPFSALILTNFSFHYGSAEEAVPIPEWGCVVPNFPCSPLDQNVINTIMETLGRYGHIPAEV